MRIYYTCCECGRNTFCDGLTSVPDPPRCWHCHAVAVLELLTPNPIHIVADRLGDAVHTIEAATRAAAEGRVVVIVIEPDICQPPLPPGPPPVLRPSGGGPGGRPVPIREVVDSVVGAWLK